MKPSINSSYDSKYGLKENIIEARLHAWHIGRALERLNFKINQLFM